jgi:hypothetical protein
MSEALIERNILSAIGARRDLRIWRSKVYPAINPRTGERVGGTSLPKGHPDLAGLIRLAGGFCAPLFIENKSETGRVSLEQRRFGAMLKAFNACYILARSPADVEAAIEVYNSDHLLRLQAYADGCEVREAPAEVLALRDGEE